MSQHVLTPEQVAEYLIDNPDFFVENPEVLPELKLPNLHPGTVSLVELQTDQLRQQLHQQRQELAQLISHADHNEQLFQIFASLMQSLYVCKSINEVEEALQGRGRFPWARSGWSGSSCRPWFPPRSGLAQH